MGLSETDGQVYKAPARGYGDGGNITPCNHKPRPPATCAGGPFDTARCLAQTSLRSGLGGRG